MSSSKLTLSMEPEVVYLAKEFAKKKNVSLSKLVENYLRSISTDETSANDDFKISDWVKKMVVVDHPTPDFDHKKEYQKHLEEKYKQI
ncbi:MAG: hypothetical protein JWQ25_709 [Daejeonella sp.]|nr:hypothetical protein [Daejeonella sp.]